MHIAYTKPAGVEILEARKEGFHLVRAVKPHALCNQRVRLQQRDQLGELPTQVALQLLQP